MLGRVVRGSRTWMCTMAAPALAASTADSAICCGVTGTAGFFPGVSADPVTAHDIITLRCMVAPLHVDDHSLVPGGGARLAGRDHQPLCCCAACSPPVKSMHKLAKNRNFAS